MPRTNTRARKLVFCLDTLKDLFSTSIHHLITIITFIWPIGKLCKCLSKLTNVYNREKHSLCHCDKLQAIPLIKMRSEIKHSGSLLKQVPRKHPTSINLVSQQLFFFFISFFSVLSTLASVAVLSFQSAWNQSAPPHLARSGRLEMQAGHGMSRSPVSAMLEPFSHWWKRRLKDHRENY